MTDCISSLPTCCVQILLISVWDVLIVLSIEIAKFAAVSKLAVIATLRGVVSCFLLLVCQLSRFHFGL